MRGSLPNNNSWAHDLEEPTMGNTFQSASESRLDR